MRSLKLFSQLLVLSVFFPALAHAQGAGVLSVTDMECGFWGRSLYVHFAGLATADGRRADTSGYGIDVPRTMNCEAFAADVLNQIHRVGNRFQARIEVSSYVKTVHVCAENGEHSDCIRHITVTRRSILLPKLQVEGQPFIVGKNI